MRTIGNDIEINVNGITICYDDLGEGVIPIVFIHGFPFNKSTWQPQIDFLKNTNRVIAYDIRGFGKSTAGNEEASMGLFADDLIKFMDALLIKKAIVCGLSMGGYILLNTIDHYPNRFEAIILSDTQCIADTAEVKEKREKTIKQIDSEGLTGFTETFIQNIFCKETLNNKKEIVEKIKNIILSTSLETITGTLTALAQRQEMCFMLRKITIPTLILCGKEDLVTPLIQSDFLQNNIKKSIFHILDNAGHLSNLEQGDTFNKYLSDFVSEIRNNKAAVNTDNLTKIKAKERE